VQNADVWTTATYQKAITLDPVNPNLRLNLAGVYNSQGKYDNARQELEIAAQLKPDLANTFYNLAYVYGYLKDPTKQIAALKTTLTLVKAGSDDAKKVQTELDNLNHNQIESNTPPTTPANQNSSPQNNQLP